MKSKKWISIAVGVVLLGTFMTTTKINAQDYKSGMPNQVAEIKALVTKLQHTVVDQLNEITSLKSTVSKLKQGSVRPTGSFKVKVQIVFIGRYSGPNDPNNVPVKYQPIVGDKVVIMDSQGKEYTGTTDKNGEYTFIVPTGMYSVRLEDSSGNYSKDWLGETKIVSTEKPITVEFNSYPPGGSP